MQKQMKKLIGILLLLIVNDTVAQNALNISGYMEIYYNHDFNTTPSFLYNFTRNNEVNLNLGYLKASYNTDRARANFTFATGTYMNANYSAEPGLLKNIYEANIGIKLSKKSNLWLDAGILPSHIGWESAVGSDNSTLSRSIAAENSPYFETGARLSYTSGNEKWYVSALLLNGWQRIQKTDGNTMPSFGTQITFKPSPAILLNSSTYIGNDKRDSIRLMRYFHDFYVTFKLHGKWMATLGFDIGAEQKTKGSSDFNTWYTPACILSYKASNKISIAARAEYYADKNNVIVVENSPNGFKTTGFSANIDYNIQDNIMWRTEIKRFDNYTALTTSLALKF
jgi:hypothetical protein